jgi:hypothetical protein
MTTATKTNQNSPKYFMHETYGQASYIDVVLILLTNTTTKKNNMVLSVLWCYDILCHETTCSEHGKNMDLQRLVENFPPS